MNSSCTLTLCCVQISHPTHLPFQLLCKHLIIPFSPTHTHTHTPIVFIYIVPSSVQNGALLKSTGTFVCMGAGDVITQPFPLSVTLQSIWCIVSSVNIFVSLYNARFIWFWSNLHHRLNLLAGFFQTRHEAEAVGGANAFPALIPRLMLNHLL